MTKIIHIVRCGETYLYVGADFVKAKTIFLDRIRTSNEIAAEKLKLPVVREKAPLQRMIPVGAGTVFTKLEITHHVVEDL